MRFSLVLAVLALTGCVGTAKYSKGDCLNSTQVPPGVTAKIGAVWLERESVVKFTPKAYMLEIYSGGMKVGQQLVPTEALDTDGNISPAACN